MKLLVGLGNPDDKYKDNRHNLGYMVIDQFSVQIGLDWQKNQDWMCHYAKSEELILAKPTTYMNKSGASVAALANFFKIKSEDILIVYDEVDLPFGKIRLTHDGVSAGHKGIDSIISGLGGFEFSRLRVGVGRPEPDTSGHTREVADFVLDNFSKEEVEKLDEIKIKCIDAINSYINDGIQATMNKFN